MTSKRDSEQQKPEKKPRPKLKKEKLRDLSEHGGQAVRGGQAADSSRTCGDDCSDACGSWIGCSL